MGATTAPSPAPAPAPATPATPSEGKKKEKKEKTPKEPKEKKEPKAEAVPAESGQDKAAKEAAKAREKLLKTVIKEGGKKGVEIEGASDMGGLEFFCTTIESPDGDDELLQISMTAMNAQPEEGAEERKGCSGHVGKMVFSAGVQQLAMVAYVPGDKTEKIDITEWSESVCSSVGGKISKASTAADSPSGGLVVEMLVAADADKGKFPIKDKDTAMAAAFAFLRSKGAFPPRRWASRLGCKTDSACCSAK